MRKLKHHFYQRHGASGDAETGNAAATTAAPTSGGGGEAGAKNEAGGAGKKAVGAKVGSLENIHWKSQGGAPGLIYRDRPLPTEGGKDGNNNNIVNNNINNNNNNMNNRRQAKQPILPLVRGPRWRSPPEGEISLIQEKLEFQKKARAKIGSLENIHYKTTSVGVYPFTSPPKGN